MRKKVITEEEILVKKIKDDINQSGLHIVEILERDGQPYIIIIRYECKIDLEKHAIIRGDGYVLTAKNANDTRREIKYFIKKVIAPEPEISKDIAPDEEKEKQDNGESAAEEDLILDNFLEKKEEIKEKPKRKIKEV